MEEHRIVCPCCGRYLIVSMTEDGIAVGESLERVLTAEESEYAAAKLGIEFGVPEGGEKIGERTHPPFWKSN